MTVYAGRVVVSALKIKSVEYLYINKDDKLLATEQIGYAHTGTTLYIPEPSLRIVYPDAQKVLLRVVSATEYKDVQDDPE